LGQVWYLGASTYGVAFLGGAALVVIVGRRKKTTPARARRRLLALLLLIGAAGILLVSALHMTPGGDRQGHLALVDSRLYGRYDEGFLAPILALGVAMLGARA